MTMPTTLSFGNGSRSTKLVWRSITPGDATQIKQRRYYLYSYEPETGWVLNDTIPCIDFKRSQLFVNGVQIVSPRITSDHVSWLQHADDGNSTHYLAGHLYLHSNGLEAHGVVISGQNHRDAVRYDVMATVIPSVKYQTKITSERYPSGTDSSKLPGDAWKTGLTLEIGYVQELGHSVPTPMVKLGDQDISEKCSWGVNENYTVLNIALDESDCAFAGDGTYAQANISFDATMLNAPAAGVVRKLCGDTTDLKIRCYCGKLRCKDSQSAWQPWRPVPRCRTRNIG